MNNQQEQAKLEFLIKTTLELGLQTDKEIVEDLEKILKGRFSTKEIEETLKSIKRRKGMEVTIEAYFESYTVKVNGKKIGTWTYLEGALEAVKKEIEARYKN